jgi:hypothetical protein
MGLGYIPGSKSRDRVLLAIVWKGRISMDEERKKLIEETGELALQYDIDYIG